MPLPAPPRFPELRDALLKLKPSGQDGFEGLAATALAQLTGLTIRLAQSGLQFGRDMRSDGGGFAVAAECKRYASDLGLDNLAGKVVIAARSLANLTDVWALCATSELNDITLVELGGILADRGIELVPLDWTNAPLPRLAVLFASAADAVLAWVDAHCAEVPGLKELLEAQLDNVRRDPAFASTEARLREAFIPARVGLGALRRAATAWLAERLADAEESRISFGQVIALEQEGLPSLPRTALVAQLEAAMVPNRQGTTVVAVLGEEGEGKTWLIARWWAEQQEPPILVIVSGRRVRELDPSKPVRSLARLLAEQAGDYGDDALRSWERRIDRWSSAQNPALRFEILLDGLNEHLNAPWADLIRSLSRLARQLGGLVCVTCRPGFWKRVIAPRLATGIEIRTVRVTKFADAEVSQILQQAGHNPERIAEGVRDFLRTARVCAVALTVLARLSVRPEELTKERLLLEYWRHRLDERGDSLVHSPNEFNDVLRAHAKAWLELSKQAFPRSEWQRYSTQPAFRDINDLQADLTEIDEGRFLTITEDDPENYSFRQEALPFAIGLLIIDELKVRMDSGETAPTILQSMLEPVRGFDLIADFIAAVMVLVLPDSAFPRAILIALIEFYSALQNRTQTSQATMTSLIRYDPDPFLDCLEVGRSELSSGSDLSFIRDLVLVEAENERVDHATQKRIARWLGQWSQRARPFQGRPEQRQTEHRSRVEGNLGLLSTAERERFSSATWELVEPPVAHLDGLAAHLLAGRPLSEHADGLLAFNLVSAIAPDLFRAEEELAWVVRLNFADPNETVDAIVEATNWVGPENSEPIRRGAAATLRLTGHVRLAEAAEQLSPRSTLRGHLPDQILTDPLTEEDIDHADQLLNRIESLNVSELRAHFSVTSEDHELRRATPYLARFRPEGLVRFIRSVVQSLSVREDMALRQLGWQLVEWGPVLSEAEIVVIERTLSRIKTNPEVLPDEDRHWITSCLVIAILPQKSADEQHQILSDLPAGLPLYDDLRKTFKALAPEEAEQALERAHQLGGEAIERSLFFLSANRFVLTERAGALILKEFWEGSDTAAACAADLILVAGDSALYNGLLDQVAEGVRRSGSEFRVTAEGRAIAAAIIATGRIDMLSHLRPAELGVVAGALEGEALVRFGEQSEYMISRLSEEASAVPPADVCMFLGTGGDRPTRWAEQAEPEQVDFVTALERMSAEPGERESIRQFADEERERRNAMTRYQRELDRDNMAELAADPQLPTLMALGRQNPSLLQSFAARLLDVTGKSVLRQQRNHALAIGAALSSQNPELAIALFRKYGEIDAIVNIVVGHERVPLREELLLSIEDLTVSAPLVEEMIDQARNDRRLAELARWIDGKARGDLLDDYIERSIGSGLAGQQARALALSGLRLQSAGKPDVLSRDWGPDFLGKVAFWATAQRHAAERTQHWLAEAAHASEPVAFWAAGVLAEDDADLRALHYWYKLEESELMAGYGEPYEKRLRKAAEKVEKNREASLFGIKSPSQRFWLLHENRRSRSSCPSDETILSVPSSVK